MRPSIFCRAVPVVALCLGGCATVDFEEHFAALQRDVTERTGAHIEWMGVSAEQKEVERNVHAMLSDGLTEEEAVRIALLFNRRLQALYGDYGIALADLKQAGLPKNPVAEFIVRYREDSPRNLRSVEAIVTQDLLDILLIPLRKGLAKAEFEQARLVVTNAVTEQVTHTRVAYYQYLQARQTLDLLKDALLAAEAGYEMAWRLRSAGNNSELALLLERSRYEQTKLAVSGAELALAERRETLNQCLGLWGKATEWEAAGQLAPLPESLPDLGDVEQGAVDASIDLALGWLGIEAAARRNGIRSIEKVIPELGIGAEFERETEIETYLGENAAGDRVIKDREGPDLWWRGPSVGVAIPIFDQGFPARARGTAMVRREWDRFTATAIEVRTAARIARYRLEFAHQVAGYHRKVVLPVQCRLRVQAQLRYNAMFMGVFGLLEVKQQEIDAARTYLETLRNYWVAQAELDQLLLGRLLPPGQSAVAGMADTGGAMGGMNSGGH